MRPSRLATTGAALLAGALALSACGKQGGPPAGASSAAPTASAQSGLSGAGATFPAPIYAKWAEAYRAQTGVDLNYQAIGSGGGIKQIKARTVDFGASDKPLKLADLDQAGTTPPITVGN